MALTSDQIDGAFGVDVTDNSSSFDADFEQIVGLGDVNGDGFDDFAIAIDNRTLPGGAFGGDNYGDYYYHGAVAVIFGDSSGPKATDVAALDGTNGFLISHETGLGDVRIASAGDVNGDNVADLVITDRLGGDTFEVQGNYGYTYTRSEGVAYVLFGGGAFGPLVDLATLDGTDGITIEGETERSGFGSSVAGAGDLNGDGFDDLVFANRGGGDKSTETYYGNTYFRYSGAAHIVYGGANLAATIGVDQLDGATGFEITGAGADGNLTSVAAVGDINGDELADIAISGSGENFDGDFGATVVLFGDGSAQSGTISISDIPGDRGFAITSVSNYGEPPASVAAAGDVNGDGVDDLIVGDGGYGFSGGGRSAILFGDADGFSEIVSIDELGPGQGVLIESESRNIANGAVAGAGDVNGDGFDDVIVTNRSYSGASATVIFGRSDFAESFDPVASNAGESITIEFADSYSYSPPIANGVGDVNGDGLADIVVAPGAYYTTNASIFFGDAAFGGPNEAPVLDNISVDLSGFGEIDLSGAAADPNLDDLTIATVAGQTVALGEAILLGSGIRVVFGGGLKLSVSAPGGVLGDQFADDIAITVTDGELESAAATLSVDLSISSTGVDGSIRIFDSGSFGSLGRQVDIAGDVNGDGFTDILVAAPRSGNAVFEEVNGVERYLGFSHGEVFVLYGSATKVVSRAVACTAFHAATHHPQGEAVRIVIPPDCSVLTGRHATEFSRPQHQRVIHHASLLQIGEQGRGWLIEDGQVTLIVVLERLVSIPVQQAIHATGPRGTIEIHITNAAFEQTTRQKAVSSISRRQRIIRVRAIKRVDMLWLAFEVARLRGR